MMERHIARSWHTSLPSITDVQSPGSHQRLPYGLVPPSGLYDRPNSFWAFEEWRHFFGGMTPNNIRSSGALPRTMPDVQLSPSIPPHIMDALNRLRQELNHGNQDDNVEPVNDFLSSRPKFGMNQFPINRFVDDADDITSANPMSIPPVKLYQQNNVLVNIERIIKRNSNNSKKKEAQKYLSEHYLPKTTSSQHTYHRPQAPTLEYPNINTVAELPGHFQAVYKNILNKAIKDATIFKPPHSTSNVYKNALTPQLFTNEILFRDVQDKSEDTTTRDLLIQNRMSDDNEDEILNTANSPLYKPFKTFIDSSSLEHPTTVSSISKTETNKITMEIMDNRNKKPDQLGSDVSFPNIVSYKTLPLYQENNTSITPKTDVEETPMTTFIINPNHSTNMSISYRDTDAKPNVTKDYNQYLNTELNGDINKTIKNNILTQTGKYNKTVMLLSDSSVDKQPTNTTQLLISNEFENIMFKGVDDMSRELDNFTVNENMPNDCKIEHLHNFTADNKNKIVNYTRDEKDAPSTSTSTNKVLTTTVSTPLLTSEEFRNIMYKGVDNTSHQYDVKENKLYEAKIYVQESNVPSGEKRTRDQVDEEKDELSIDILRNLTSGNDPLTLKDEYADKTNQNNTETEETSKEARLLIDLLTGTMHDDITNEFGDAFSEEYSDPKAVVPQPSSIYKLIQDIPDIVADSAELNDTISPDLIQQILASYNTDISETNPDTDLYENIDFQDFLENDLILKQTNNNISKHETNFLPPTIVHNDNKVQSEFETGPVTTIGPRSSEEVANRQIDVPLLKHKDHASEISHIYNDDQQTTADNTSDDLIFDAYYTGEGMPLSRSNHIDDLKTTVTKVEYTTPIYIYSSTQNNEMLFTEKKYSAANSENAENVLVIESSRIPSVTNDFGDSSSILTGNTVSTVDTLLIEDSSIIPHSNSSEQVTEYFSTPQPISESHTTQDNSDMITQKVDTVIDNERYNNFKTTINTLNNVIRNLDSLNVADRFEEMNLPKVADIEEERSLLQMNNKTLISTTNIYPVIFTEQLLQNADTTITPKYDINNNKSHISSEQSLSGIHETYDIKGKEMSNIETPSTDRSYTTYLPHTETTFDLQNITDNSFPEAREYYVATEHENENATSIKVKNNQENRNVAEFSDISEAEVSSSDMIYTTYFPNTEMIMDTSVTEVFPDTRECSTVLYTTPVTPDYEDKPSTKVKKSNQKKNFIGLPKMSNEEVSLETTTNIMGILLPESRKYSAVTNTISQGHKYETSIKPRNSNEQTNFTELNRILNVEVLPTDRTQTSFMLSTQTALDTESITEIFFPHIREYSILTDNISATTDHTNEMSIDGTRDGNGNGRKNLIDISDILSTTKFSNTSKQALNVTKMNQNPEKSEFKENDVNSETVFTTEETVFYESSEVIDTKDMHTSNIAADSSDRSATETLYTTTYTVSPVTELL